jgi:hypothetical protein
MLLKIPGDPLQSLEKSGHAYTATGASGTPESETLEDVGDRDSQTLWGST